MSNTGEVQPVQFIIHVRGGKPGVDPYRFQKRYISNRYHNDPEFKKKVNARSYELQKQKKARANEEKSKAAAPSAAFDSIKQ